MKHTMAPTKPYSLCLLKALGVLIITLLASDFYQGLTIIRFMHKICISLRQGKFDYKTDLKSVQAWGRLTTWHIVLKRLACLQERITYRVGKRRGNERESIQVYSSCLWGYQQILEFFGGSPIQVLYRPNIAQLQCSNSNWCIQHGSIVGRADTPYFQTWLWRVFIHLNGKRACRAGLTIGQIHV